MAARFDYYKAPQPADLAPGFRDLVQNAPGQGAMVAARALREALDRRTQREFEADQNRANRQFQRDQSTIGYERDLSRDAANRAFHVEQSTLDRAQRERAAIMGFESDALNRASREQQERTQAQASLQKQAMDDQDAADEQTAMFAARGVVASLLNDKSEENPFFRHVKVSPGTVLFPNKSEDEILDVFMQGHAPARPYLDEKATADVRKMVKGLTGARDMVLWNPNASGALYHQVMNGTLTQLGAVGRMSPGMQRGVAKALDAVVDDLPTDELTAAEQERDKTFKRLEGVFGTAAPAAQQTRALQPAGQQALDDAAPGRVPISASDFDDDFLAGLAGSTTQGINMKDRLGLGASLGRSLPTWVPVRNADGSTYITIEGVAPQDAVLIERAVNQGGSPYRDRILGRLKSGGTPVTDAEAKKAGAREGSTVPPSTPAVRPTPGQGPPQTQQPTGGSPIQAIAPDLLHFINGQPKK